MLISFLIGEKYTKEVLLLLGLLFCCFGRVVVVGVVVFKNLLCKECYVDIYSEQDLCFIRPFAVTSQALAWPRGGCSLHLRVPGPLMHVI